LSHLSYTFKKVLAPELGKILSNLFTLYKKTLVKQIKKMAYTTIKVFAKYSGDLKTLVYILLMPTEMRERYKLIASRMLEVMLTGVERDPYTNQGNYFFHSVSCLGYQLIDIPSLGLVTKEARKDWSNLNIFDLEELMMARLVKIACEYFGDVEQVVREHGEKMICGLWERFKEARKGSVFF